jgi:molybdenum cofactor cytidylyltransferase
MTFALIPAAGKSTRMGCAKLALPLGNKTVLEHVIAALGEAGIEHILVVVGPHVAELVPLAEAAGAYALLLADETVDMRATVERGLCWFEERFQPGDAENWLLLPADHPTVDPAVVRQLLLARATHPTSSIIIPTFQARRGHPALIGWKHFPGIRALPAGVGINAYLRQQAAQTLEVPVALADILCDLDTPEDYERLRQSTCHLDDKGDATTSWEPRQSGVSRRAWTSGTMEHLG